MIFQEHEEPPASVIKGASRGDIDPDVRQTIEEVLHGDE